MMQPKQFVVTIIATGYLFLCGMIALNYVVDPFEIANSQFFKPVQHFLNQRVVKMRTIDANPEAFDGYIMGSSRSHEIAPHDVERYIPGAHFFTLSTNDATAEEQMRTLRYMLAHHYPIKHLLIQWDIPQAPYDRSLDARDYKAATEMFPPRFYDHDWKYGLAYFKVYFLQLRFDELWFKYSHRNIAGPAIRFGIDGTANWIKAKTQMAEDPDRYVREHFPPKPVIRRFRGSMADLQGNIDAAKRYVALCHAHQIHCIFFTPPINRHNLDEWNVEYYLAYFKALSELTEFWSFSDYNSVTMDDYRYVDDIHYHPKLVPVIMARIFHDPSIKVPGDFGHYITTKTVGSYLQMLREQFAAQDAAYAQ